MKRLKTKAEVRAEIEAQVSTFLHNGGEVHQHERGESGRSFAQTPFKVQATHRPSEARTPVQDAIAAIESRRGPQKIAPAQKRKPRKILIKDDFGQPLRWVWEE